MTLDWHHIGDTSISTTAVSAACASTITKSLLFPMDTLKCRMQSFAGTNQSVWHLSGIFRGLLPKLALYAPYQSVYMSTYTWTRDRLSPHIPGFGTFALAGVAAELTGSVIRVPMEAVKQRMQTGHIASNTQLISLLRENPFRFFKARNFVAQTLVHDLPCGVVHWVVYERVKRGEVPFTSSPVIAGAAAGSVAAVVTNPLDVIKTRMITRPDEVGHMTVASTARTVMTSAGIGGFWKGVVPRILHIAPNSALYMWIFDHLYTRFSSVHSDIPN